MSADKESSLRRKWPLTETTETGRRGEQGPRKNVTEARQQGEAGLADGLRLIAFPRPAVSSTIDSTGRRYIQPASAVR